MTESNAAEPALARPLPGLFSEPWRLTLATVAAIGLVRLVTLFVTPLELYPDEAQYWTWSHTLDFGYWSKPPMVAWLIAASTGIGGDGEAWIRLPSMLVHLGAALFLYGAGARLFDRWSGYWAAVIYLLMPGVMVSSLVASTDAGLLFFTAAALWAYAGLYRAGTERERMASALALGIALGLGFLSKYAVLYFAGGLVLHALAARDARAAWRARAAAVTVAAFALIALPNILWNAAHRFATVRHTAENANLKGGLFHPEALVEFLVGQVGVFGPVALAALATAGVLALRRRTATAVERLLWCLTLPPLAVVTVLSILSRANANWAAIAYVPASVLAAAWMTRAARARLWLGATVGLQGLITLAAAVLVMAPALADAAGLANSLKRLRGWRETARLVIERADRERALAPLAAVSVDDRFAFYELAYYARDWLAEPGAPPLKIWVRRQAGNQAEATAPLTRETGRRALIASVVTNARGEIARDFAVVGPLEEHSVRLDRKHERDVVLFVGEDFAPQPRK
jgi:4-amino-4-deoxy-L-arabinose transferase-like glycosyltransferase